MANIAAATQNSKADHSMGAVVIVMCGTRAEKTSSEASLEQ